MVEKQDVDTGIILGTPKRNGEDALFISRQPSAFIDLFPSERTLYWKPALAANGTTDAVPILITQPVLLAVNEHVSQKPYFEHDGSQEPSEGQDSFVELGGFLLGNRYRCPDTDQEYIIIDCSSEALFTKSTEHDLEFTPDTWAHFADEFDLQFRNKLLVGWYHSHPGSGVFLSGMDVGIHKERFSDFWTTALVIDPVKRIGGFFCWKDGKLETQQPTAFYEYLNHDSKESVVEWLNYKCVDPKTGNELEPPKRPINRVRRGVATGQGAGEKQDSKSPYLLAAGALITALLLLGVIFGPKLYTQLTERKPPVIEPPPPVTFREETNPLASIDFDADKTVTWVKGTSKLEVLINLAPHPDNVIVTIDKQPAVLRSAPKDSKVFKIIATAELPEMVDRLKKFPSDVGIRVAVADKDRPEFIGRSTMISLNKREVIKLFTVGVVTGSKQPIVTPAPLKVSVPATTLLPSAIATPNEVKQQQNSVGQQEQRPQTTPEGPQSPAEGDAKEALQRPVETPRQDVPARKTPEPKRETLPQPERRNIAVQQPQQPVIYPPPPEDKRAMEARHKREKDELKEKYEVAKDKLKAQFKDEEQRLKASDDKEGAKRRKREYNYQKDRLDAARKLEEKGLKEKQKVEKQKFKDN